ncbi:MAG TPA: DUF58 domain-containing protein [Gemmatimonadaceae bacterium]|nr:DUF58 domain-containing protein [Gemmatimonadaceae bacterium]
MRRVEDYGVLLDAVRGVRWPARRKVTGALPGAHQSRMRGIAPEFAEYRPYRQGDDPRRLDWRVLARTDRAYLRLSTDRSILATMLVVDASASMAYPPETLDKWQCARRLAIALAAVAYGERDPVGAIVNTERGMLRLGARTRRGVVGELARMLDHVHPGGAPALGNAARAAMTSGRVVVITDFLGDAEALLAVAREHTAAGGEVHAVHILAREELDPPARAVTAVDPEDDEVARTLAPATREEYLSSFAAWREGLARDWRAAGATHTAVAADEPVARAVRRIVAPAFAGAAP